MQVWTVFHDLPLSPETWSLNNNAVIPPLTFPQRNCSSRDCKRWFFFLVGTPWTSNSAVSLAAIDAVYLPAKLFCPAHFGDDITPQNAAHAVVKLLFFACAHFPSQKPIDCVAANWWTSKPESCRLSAVSLWLATRYRGAWQFRLHMDTTAPTGTEGSKTSATFSIKSWP